MLKECGSRHERLVAHLIDEARQWNKACIGGGPDEERAISFCNVAIQTPEPLVVEDAREDPRFATNPRVTGPPYVRFYAGHPLATADGYLVGTLCLVDTEPRAFGAREEARLRDLAQIAEQELNQSELARALAAKRESD